MANYFNLKNDQILNPPANTSLGSNASSYGTIHVENSLVLGNVNLTSTSISTILEGGSGATTSVYANVSTLPNSNVSNGTLAYVSQTNSLYVQSNSQWKRVYTGSDSTLDVTTEPESIVSLNFANAATVQHVVTFAASDPDGFPVSYGYAINPANSVNIQSVAESNGVYTLQTTANASTLGSAIFRMTATDGLHVVSRSQTLNFVIIAPIILSGGTASSTIYTAPNGTVVTSSDTVYDITPYSLAYLFNNTTSGAYGGYWLSSSASIGTLTFNFSNTPVRYLHAIQIFPRTRDDSYTSITSIQISTDGITWTTVPNTSLTVNANTAFGFSQTFALATTNKYVRLNLSRAGAWGMSLDEVKFTGG